MSIDEPVEVILLDKRSMVSPKPDSTECSIGDYINSIDNYTIYDRDCDIYDATTDKLLAKFRKRAIIGAEAEEAQRAFGLNIKSLANRKKESRGAAAGTIDRAKLRQSVKGLFNTKKYRTNFYKGDGTASGTSICNYAKSNVVGYIDTPARVGYKEKVNLAAYCRDYPEKYKKCIPLIVDLCRVFNQVDEELYEKQYNLLEEQYRIKGTPFSTVTVNYSWQTAIHLDANNGKDCLACITVIKDPVNENNYTGGELLFPEYHIGFNVGVGDVLIADTVNNYHGNSPINPTNTEIHGDWPNIDLHNNWYLNRISIVAYIKKSCIRN